MTAAANELLQAIHAALATDAGLTALIGADGVRDRLVTGRQLPCVVTAELISNDYSTATEPKVRIMHICVNLGKMCKYNVLDVIHSYPQQHRERHQRDPCSQMQRCARQADRAAGGSMAKESPT